MFKVLLGLFLAVFLKTLLEHVHYVEESSVQRLNSYRIFQQVNNNFNNIYLIHAQKTKSIDLLCTKKESWKPCYQTRFHAEKGLNLSPMLNQLFFSMNSLPLIFTLFMVFFYFIVNFVFRFLNRHGIDRTTTGYSPATNAPRKTVAINRVYL